MADDVWSNIQGWPIVHPTLCTPHLHSNVHVSTMWSNNNHIPPTHVHGPLSSAGPQKSLSDQNKEQMRSLSRKTRVVWHQWHCSILIRSQIGGLAGLKISRSHPKRLDRPWALTFLSEHLLLICILYYFILLQCHLKDHDSDSHDVNWIE